MIPRGAFVKRRLFFFLSMYMKFDFNFFFSEFIFFLF